MDTLGGISTLSCKCTSIDARKYHYPANAPHLVAKAISLVGSQIELAARLGVSTRYLQLLFRDERTMSYALQVTLEVLASAEKQGS